MGLWDSFYAAVLGGASAGAAGRKGLVPAPAAGDQDKVLHGDATWRATTNASAASNLEASQSSSTTKFLTPANGVYAGSPAFNLRPPRPGVYFDGTTSASISLTPGTAAALAADDCAFILNHQVLDATPTSSHGLLTFGSATSYSTAYGLGIYYASGTNHLVIEKIGATTSDWRKATLTDFRTTYSGKAVLLAIVRSVSGNSLTVYANGVALTTSESTGGAGASWSDTITTTAMHVGSLGSGLAFAFKGAMYGVSVYNCALSASDVEEIFFRGGAVSYRFQFASQTARYASDFSAGTDIWAQGDGSPTLTGNVDGIGGVDDTLRITATASSHTNFLSNNFANYLSQAKALKISWDQYWTGNTSAVGITPLGLNGGTVLDLATGAAIGVQTSADGVWTSKSVSILAYPMSTHQYRFSMRTSANGTGITSGDIFYMKNIKFTQLGAVVHLTLDEGIGYQLHDASTNKLDAVMTTTGISHLLAKREGYVRTPGSGLSWSGTHEAKSISGVAGQILPTNVVATLFTTKASAASTGSGATFGTTTNAGWWVTGFNPLTTPKKNWAISNALPPGSGGTDLDVLIDPDTANYTGTIQAELHYKVTEG